MTVALPAPGSRSREGWYRCASAVRRRRDQDDPGTWHYFDAGDRTSRCGLVSSFERLSDDRAAELSGFYLGITGSCRNCDRTRRREEGR
jgi:hypothetical protein